MTTRRINVPRNADGSPMNFQQRRQVRLKQEREQRIQERQQKEQAAIEAALNPPPPPESSRESAARRKAEAEGRAKAQFEAEQRAAANAPPANWYRETAQRMEGQRYLPSVARRYERFMALADELDQQRAAEAEQAAKQAELENSPAVVTSRTSAGLLVKMAEQAGDAELVKQAQECAGIAAACNPALYWERMKAVETQILNVLDTRAAERRAVKAQADADFEQAASIAQDAKEKLSAGEVERIAAPEAAA
jgi:hypothetical protein